MPGFAPPTDRPTYPDPAQQAAIGVCMTFRQGGNSNFVQSAAERHGPRCFFCQFSPDMLMTYLAEFQPWEPTFDGRRVMSAWYSLSQRRQRERVVAAGHPADWTP